MKPHVIMITLDGARIDRMQKLPNFQRLVKQSTFFPLTITYAPYTIGAMHAIFSGAYGYHNGVNCYYASKNFREGEFDTIASNLKREGYSTVGDVLNLICVPQKGFDEFEEHDADTDDLVKRHTAILERMRDSAEPFFAFLHYTKIQNSIKVNVSRKFNNFSKEYFAQQEKNASDYDGYAKKADEYLGAILDVIDELGLQDALLLVHADHGMGTGEKFGEKAYGAYCYDYTLKAFALFRQKELFPVMVVRDQIRTIDLLPTLLDYLDIAPNEKMSPMDGKSARNLIDGEHELRDAFAESGNPYPDPKVPPQKPNVKAVRVGGWKLIRNLWDNNREELYHVAVDESEDDDLIDEKPEKAEELRKLLNHHIRESLKADIARAKL